MPLPPLVVSTAIQAVLDAGAVQKARFGTGVAVRHKGTIDLVTEVDVAIERRFRELVGERFPDHAILAEELQEPGGVRGSSDYCWVFDPLDGTTNFAHGLPIFCASLGIEHRGEVVFGAVYDPMREELFTAERGEGAFLNGARLQVSQTGALIDALLCTGFPYDVHQRVDEVVGLFREFVARARAVRRLGSAALDLCYVAAGRLDGFWEARLNPWDTCAGALVVLEAGGTVTAWDGRPYQSRMPGLVATNGRLHGAMLDVIDHHARRSAGRTD
jgi:myo-inositol-1(or 4)-monophosphatase